MGLTRLALGVAGAALCISCAGSGPELRVPDLTLPDARGGSQNLALSSRSARATLLFFFSADCPCQSLHDARIRELYAQYHPRGVAFFAVDSQGSDRARGSAEAEARGYAFPMLLDPGARLADRVGAEYATYTLVLDAEGAIRYRGGFDSDRIAETDDREQWARRALDDVLAGRAPRVPMTKALGCALRRF